ncbi:MAG: hypothetical protein LUE93_17020 [Bacteroides sp.]|nr:hypothetical protein [Bacteroides sp.]
MKPGIPQFANYEGGYRVQPGDPMYADLNGDGKIDDNDRTTLGSPIPKFIGGLSNTFTYKNWSLNVFFQYSLGNKILDYNKLLFETTGTFNKYTNNYASYANYWTPENTDTDIPRLLKPYNRGDVQSRAKPKVSSRVIEDGSFIRLNTVSLSYSIPKTILSKVKVSSASVSFSAQNLWLWTKYSGQDPEVDSFNNNAAPKGLGYNVLTNSNAYTSMTGGYDRSQYPRAKVFNLGLNVSF